MRAWIVTAAVLSLGGCTQPPRPAVRDAAAWLWSQQGADGGWHSKTYGLLESGQSMTPFVLEALAQVPENVYPLPRPRVERALAFLTSRTRPDGSIGTADIGIPDYPNYATALTVSALARIRGMGWRQQIAPMVEYLRQQQFTEQNDWERTHPAYGGWGMGGERRTPPGTGHVDLSMTRFVLEALRAAGLSPEDPSIVKARVFLERCQNKDGGFFFSTTEADTNKAGEEEKGFRSYGTTTADGILALLATGYKKDCERVQAANNWLAAHHRDHEVPGFVGEAYRRWPRGLLFYYSAASTEAFASLGWSPGDGVLAYLRQSQRADGSWVNSENLVKEDDPLVATPFALRALLKEFANSGKDSRSLSVGALKKQ